MRVYSRRHLMPLKLSILYTTNMDIQKIISYLESRLAETRHRPDLHAHTIQVYNKLLEAAHVSLSEYGKVAGNMFEVLKAEELDRQRSLFTLYKKLEHPYRMRAHKALYEAIKSSTSHADIFSLKGSNEAGTG